MNCEICSKKSSTRIVAGVKLCENCFSLISKLREGDPSAHKFFTNRYNLIYSTMPARNLIESFMPNEVKTEAAPSSTPAPEACATTSDPVSPKPEKYDVVEFSGSSEELKGLLNEKSNEGYHLHTIYEKNGLTELIFERNS